MRHFILPAILAATAVTGLSTSSDAQPQCIRGRGCVPATPATYNQCYNLAIARGESPLWGERKRLDWFIYQCLAGKIPR